MSTDYQKTTAKAIPSARRVTINDSAHMPLDYSTTPGGTLFSTTPGGTNIYDLTCVGETCLHDLCSSDQTAILSVSAWQTP